MANNMDAGACFRELQAQWKQAIDLHLRGGLYAHAILADIQDLAQVQDRTLGAAPQVGISRGMRTMTSCTTPVPAKDRIFRAEVWRPGSPWHTELPTSYPSSSGFFTVIKHYCVGEPWRRATMRYETPWRLPQPSCWREVAWWQRLG